VTNTNDSGSGSLRTALTTAYNNSRTSPPIATTISFRIPKTDSGYDGTAFYIRPLSPLPGVPNGTTIDGTSQSLFIGHTNATGPELVLNGSRLGSYVTSGLVLSEANCLIRSITINGFNQHGILLSGTQSIGNVITGCYIGTDATGSTAVPNSLSAVQIRNGAHGNTIGGVTAAERNVLSGNYGCGINVTDSGSDSNVITGNFIGLSANGSTGIPNSLEGIAILNSARFNIVGGSTLGAGNRVWSNGQEGIAVYGATTIWNKLSQNSVYNNGAGGIVLYNNANGQQAAPVISTATLGASDQNVGGIDIVGTLTSTPNTSFMVEFFANNVADPSGYGQGKVFIGNAPVTTNSNGSRPFTIKLPAAVPTGYYISAKAIAPDGNTSPLSPAKIVTISSDTDKDGLPTRYESFYGLNTNSADANADSDGDGLTNMQEFRAGTNPKSSASRFAVSSIDFITGVPRITFQSVAGKTYRVEYTDDIRGPWKILMYGIYTAQPTLVQVPDQTASTAGRSYRVTIDF